MSMPPRINAAAVVKTDAVVASGAHEWVFARRGDRRAELAENIGERMPADRAVGEDVSQYVAVGEGLGRVAERVDEPVGPRAARADGAH